MQPTAPPTLYCAECGCEVDPVAWLCATCGRNLHEPGAMSSVRPFATATTKRSKLDFITGEYLFILLVGMVLAILCVLSEFHEKYSDSFSIFGVVLSGAFWIVYCLDVYFDR